LKNERGARRTLTIGSHPEGICCKLQGDRTFQLLIKKSTKIELSYTSYTGEFRIEHAMNRLKRMIPGNTNVSQTWRQRNNK
jgi:hypothetical protein